MGPTHARKLKLFGSCPQFLSPSVHRKLLLVVRGKLPNVSANSCYKRPSLDGGCGGSKRWKFPSLLLLPDSDLSLTQVAKQIQAAFFLSFFWNRRIGGSYVSTKWCLLISLHWDQLYGGHQVVTIIPYTVEVAMFVTGSCILLHRKIGESFVSMLALSLLLKVFVWGAR